MSNLPGNPHASVAMERLREMTSPESMTFDLEKAIDALVQSNLAVAHETRTATLATMQVANVRSAERIYGSEFQDAPAELIEFLNKRGIEVNERLGATDD
ncbi:hypothetical protein [Glutamicibacter creatinolyticus]|uniref:hypothetical protein n=1 Tax=Glutamicibacter creatinolyticus TaxID=162496 RepID=UPI003217D3CE